MVQKADGGRRTHVAFLIGALQAERWAFGLDVADASAGVASLG